MKALSYVSARCVHVLSARADGAKTMCFASAKIPPASGSWLLFEQASMQYRSLSLWITSIHEQCGVEQLGAGSEEVLTHTSTGSTDGKSNTDGPAIDNHHLVPLHCRA